MDGTDYNTPAPIGHNSGLGLGEPVEDLATQAKRAIDTALAPIIAIITKRIESAGRAKIDNLEDAGKVTDLLALLASSEGSINRAHAEAKAPYLDAGRVVDGRAAEWRDKVREAVRSLNTMLTAWQQAEAKRIADLREAERLAEAADPEPTLAPSHAAVDTKRAAVRGDFGASARLADVLVIESVEVKKLPKAFLERAKIIAVIEAEAKVVIRAGGKVTGVKSTTTTQSRVRKGG